MPRTRKRPALPLLIASVASLILHGCSLFRPAPFNQEVPSDGDLAGHPGMTQLMNGPDRAAGLREAFPEVGEFISSSRVTVTRRRFFIFRFRTQLDASLISGDEKSLRMVARHPGDATTVLDMMVAENMMRVYLPLNGRGFQGELKAGASPFADALGVEPWELRPIFSIGQKLAEIQPDWRMSGTKKGGAGGHTLVPRDPEAAGGLQSVVMDPKSGLPREASFARGKARWKAEYTGWGLFKNSEDDTTAWLMPSKIIVRNSKPRATLEITVRQYRMNPRPDPRRWTLTVPPGTPMGSLDELEKGLEHL